MFGGNSDDSSGEFQFIKKPISYKEKLKDPRWQRKRLYILDRDGFKCRYCGDNKSSLQVHHHFYINGTEPWEYDDEVYVTLCGKCHVHEEEMKKMDLNSMRLLLMTGIGRDKINYLVTELFRYFKDSQSFEYKFQVLSKVLNKKYAK